MPLADARKTGHHTVHLRGMPHAVVDHARHDVGKINEPKE
jgi:hypothetical protein